MRRKSVATELTTSSSLALGWHPLSHRLTGRTASRASADHLPWRFPPTYVRVKAEHTDILDVATVLTLVPSGVFVPVLHGRATSIIREPFSISPAVVVKAVAVAVASAWHPP